MKGLVDQGTTHVLKATEHGREAALGSKEGGGAAWAELSVGRASGASRGSRVSRNSKFNGVKKLLV